MGWGPKVSGKGGAVPAFLGHPGEEDVLELFEPEVGKGFLMVSVGHGRGQECGDDYSKGE